MFSHTRDLQFEARPDGPDAAFAGRLQEALGGKWGALTVAHQYLFQGWTCRVPGKYQDLLLDIGTEEMAHVEMISTMIACLLQDAPLSVQEAVADGNPTMTAVYGAANPAHFIQAGAGPLPVDSNGTPWSGAYVTSSGNLLADFHLNVTAEAQGRLQVARLFHMTDDPGVKQMLRFLLARGTMHQNAWLAAIEDLRRDGLEDLPVPDAFPDAPADRPLAYTHLSFSGDRPAGSDAGRWTGGPAPDGKGELRYGGSPSTSAQPPAPAAGDPRLYTTPPSTAD